MLCQLKSCQFKLRDWTACEVVIHTCKGGDELLYSCTRNHNVALGKSRRK